MSHTTAAWTAVDAWQDRLIALSHSLHAEPETAFQEHASAAKLATLLEQAGFAVEREACELPTALIATYGAGDLTVGICAEYDALPEIGHACGHNMICAAAAGAAIGLREVADELGIRIKLIGTPAEEEGGGKVLMLDRGAFDDVTVAMMAHPAPGFDVADTAMTTQTVSRFHATFHGRASHAAAAPTVGINAADAAVVAQVAIGQLRQQTDGRFRIAGIVVDGGQRTNIIPERASLEYEVRTLTAEQLPGLKERVQNCFHGAALATGTAVEFRPTQPDYLDLRQDPYLTAAYGDALSKLGRESQPMPAGVTGGSTDMGNISQVMPSIHPGMGINGATAMPHTRDFTDATASPAADEALIAGAKALAGAAIALAGDAEQRAAVQKLQAGRGTLSSNK
ncbi:putative peptidase/amidohydrolase [Actinoplanes sp. OR16]|uniref:amidohydrolase n=1 Tax=Actinoplanes sp. OR16 TaxID=946334 RepID=UPI000F6F8027|nr:amidohydrolase [Actinoplanes sp. OR16]BBH70041.1 putative peptidase/amidohydrolase [Actinoplanes sp. OR16]